MTRTTTFAGVLLAALISMMLWVGWLLFLEPPWLSYRNLPFEVQAPTARPGELVPLHVVRCNATDAVQTYAIARSLENLDTGQYFVLPESLVQIRPGCHDETSLANRVPANGVPPGRYRIIGMAEIQGTLRTMHVPWWSRPFEVTA